MRGSSMPDIGVFNERVVLEVIRSSPEGLSQSEVGRLSGLSRQAVSLISRRLVERGLIEAAGTRTRGRGKPHTVLRVVPRALLTAGVHLDPAGITVVIGDMLARVVTKRSLDPATDSPETDIDRIVSALDEMRGEIDGVPLLGIGVASPGGLDIAHGIVVDPPWLPGWRNVPVVDLLEAATGRPVILDKDTDAALTAERWAGHAAPGEDTLYIYVGAGIGSSAAAGGRVHRGATTQAGEIGHLPTGLDGPRCVCGMLACLNLYTDAQGMLERATAAGLAGAGAGRSVAASLTDLVDLARVDPRARDVLDMHAVALGEALRTLIAVHDPHRLIIGGPYWRLLEELEMPIVRDHALRERGELGGVTISSSSLGDDVGAIGAACLVLERELAPGPGAHQRP